MNCWCRKSRKRNTITFGSEYLLDDVNDIISAYNYEINQETKNFAAFLQSDWLINSILSLLSGIRTDQDNLIDNNIFRPINISRDIRLAFARNAASIGEVNPLERADEVIANIRSQMSNISLSEPNFPFIENPLLPSAQETPVTPSSLNLPNIDSVALHLFATRCSQKKDDGI